MQKLIEDWQGGNTETRGDGGDAGRCMMVRLAGRHNCLTVDCGAIVPEQPLASADQEARAKMVANVTTDELRYVCKE